MQEAESGRPARTRCAACSREAKYRCPACDTPSCSLACVKQHKTTKPCTGKRDLTTFCAIGDFDDRTLLSDYHFLESAMQSVESAGRAAAAVPAPGTGSGSHPARRKLASAAMERGIHLDLLPLGMQRQKENTSYFDARRKRIAWRVELVFDRLGIRQVETAVPETTTLRFILASLLLPKPMAPDPPVAASDGLLSHIAPQTPGEPAASSQKSGGGAKSRTIPPEDGQRLVLRHRLRSYAREGLQDLLVFMAVHRRPANDSRFHALDLDASIGETLRSRVVLEFPTLYIVCKSECLEAYPLLGENLVCSTSSPAVERAEMAASAEAE